LGFCNKSWQEAGNYRTLASGWGNCRRYIGLKTIEAVNVLDLNDVLLLLTVERLKVLHILRHMVNISQGLDESSGG